MPFEPTPEIKGPLFQLVPDRQNDWMVIIGCMVIDSGSDSDVVLAATLKCSDWQ